MTKLQWEHLTKRVKTSEKLFPSPFSAGFRLVKYLCVLLFKLSYWIPCPVQRHHKLASLQSPLPCVFASMVDQHKITLLKMNKAHGTTIKQQRTFYGGSSFKISYGPNALKAIIDTPHLTCVKIAPSAFGPLEFIYLFILINCQGHTDQTNQQILTAKAHQTNICVWWDW